MKLLRQVVLMAVLTGSGFAADYFPLQAGNLWTYRNSTTGQTFNVQVGLPYFIFDRVYYKLNGYTSRPALVRINEQSDLVGVDEETGAEVRLTSFLPSRMTWWDAPWRGCEQDGQALARRGTHDGPLGPIREVVELRYRVFGCADTGVATEQYAENLGMVRRVMNTIAGPGQFDLIYARVGKSEWNALPRTGFSVSVQAERTGDVSVTLRLRNNGGPVKLGFPSGQEYDAHLVDKFGNVVWKWSDGQVFSQGSHDRDFGSEWSATLTIPRLVFPAGGAEKGQYLLRTWLTTASKEFSSAIPLMP